MPATHAAPTPEDLLARFGLSAFRPGQREAVRAALEGRDSLVVMPTGSGKSLCYQLPALAGRGLVVVVSPLIALMADQSEHLRQAGVRAAMLASGMEEGHNARALAEIESGQVELVLAAPERFASRVFRAALSTRRVALFAVDEAHCVAEWGHDFRPDYLRLHGAIGSLTHGYAEGGRPPVMAATATATPRVAREIAERLGLRDWVAVSSGFDRPNLTFDVVGVEGKGAVARKRAALLHVLQDPAARPAIVYCGTRRDTEEVASLIAGHGIPAVPYHAGIAPEERRCNQTAFMEGAVEVIVATNAFGMGVDKSDVRTVAHWAIPTSLEAYYQEAGRGGRDGEPARALLLASRMDLGRLIRFNMERTTSLEDVRRYAVGLRARAPEGLLEIGPGELDDRERLLLSIAERSGAVELEPGARGTLQVRLTGRIGARAAAAAIRAAKDRGWESYRAIERFISNGEECRRAQILEHFADEHPAVPSGRCCSVCAPDEELARALTRTLPATRGRRQTPTATRTRPGTILGDRGRGGRATADARGAALDSAEPLEPVDEAELARLKAWRMERAEGKPAYTVLTNAALEEVLRRRPGDVSEMIEIRGIGPAFCEKHAASLLGVLAELGGAPSASAGQGAETSVGSVLAPT
ncbi:MAG TPA: ATP-dependent DNA helicase RecQ [Solirubrobacteraceae bacterium]|nr:ATP-dependent DNA helicase RecQ [Solirubrobacteraceae bacterium]